MFGNKYTSKNIAQAMGDIQEGLAKERETITKKLDDTQAKKDKAIKDHELAMQKLQEDHDKALEKLDTTLGDLNRDLNRNSEVTKKLEKVLG